MSLINITQNLVLTGDIQNPRVCLRAVFPTCTGLSQAPVQLRNQPLDMFRGDDLEITFSVIDESGLEVDITNAQRVQWWFGRSAEGPAIVAKERQKGDVLFSGGVVLQGSGFQFRISLNRPDTVNLEPGAYYHEAKIFTDNQRSVTVAYGRLNIRRELIRPENEPE